MFGSKTRELEELLRKRNAEYEELTARSGGMERRLAGYQAKEEAIIGALTEAKTAAARIVAAAEKVRDDMMEDAEQSKKLAAEEAERVLNDARLHAEEIEHEARLRAEELLESVENEVSLYRETLAAFNSQLLACAKSAKEYAERFDAFARGAAITDDSAEVEYGTAAIHNRLEQEPAALPEDYETPAALMRGIYSLQGRDLPPIGSYGHENESDEDYEQDPDAPKETDLSREFVVDDGAENKDDAQPEHVWTVDEIISDAMAKAESDITVDAQLNALIDDVLKG